jgi:magnesium-transporting ATPase (P-type)
MRLVEKMIAKRKGGEEIGELDQSKHIIIEEFTYNFLGLTSKEAKKLLEVYGTNELPETVIPKWYIFVSQLWQPMPVMIWIAAIVEAAIENWLDMGIIISID